MYQRKHSSWIKHWDFILSDLLVMQMSVWIVYFIFRETKLESMFLVWRTTAVVLFLSQALVSVFLESFKNVLRRGYYKEFSATVKHTLYVLGLTLLALYLIHEIGNLSRVAFIVSLSLYFALAYITRSALKAALRQRGRSNNGNRSVVIVTEERNVRSVLNDFRRPEFGEHHVHGIVLLGQETIPVELDGIPCFRLDEEMVDFLAHDWVNEVLIYLTDQSLMPQTLVDELIRMGISVHTALIGPDNYGEQYVEKFGNYTVLTNSIKMVTPKQMAAKRALDILGGVVGCLITLVLTILVGPIIFLKDPGPIFFKQKRIGKDGKVFHMYKFRSMYKDAEARKKELMDQNKMDGLMFKMDNDPRIIKGIGNFIRNTSIDEFPQFFNVLKGDMSLVGTRPPTLDEWEQYDHKYRVRMSIKPGITGLWQTSGRSEITDFDEVVKLDAQYIREWNFGLDIKLILKTVVVVFKREGAE